ncbi:mucin-5B-like [Gymnodraco acuticeps]|uniref:Mucin-5B-like n=1 Tax=Gymnodraco acuticeps TaxID=8218 RepID=A0A6P8U322_GYMAC|nr:mucin-5B-like [Gymnodraco acuticeps]
MIFEMNLVFCMLVVLTGPSQTRGQSGVLPPVLTPAAPPSHAGSSASPDLTEHPGNEPSQWTYNPAGGDGTPTQTTTMTKTEVTVHSETVTNSFGLYQTQSSTATSLHTNVPASLSAATESLSSAPTVQSSASTPHISTTEGRAALTTDPFNTFSSPAASSYPVQDTSSTAHASTLQPQSEPLTSAPTQPTTKAQPLTSAPGRGPAGPTHREVPPQLNVGDEDLKRPRSSSPLDPLLAGLLSVFIVTTAIVFVVLFLKFRQRTTHPEFHRLQDLPMDDLMEDTPLSRYSY